MSDLWGDDWGPPKTADKASGASLASDSTSSAGGYEIRDSTGQTQYRPQKRILKRDSSGSPSPNPSPSESRTEAELQKQLEAKQENYQKVRDKIFGKEETRR